VLVAISSRCILLINSMVVEFMLMISSVDVVDTGKAVVFVGNFVVVVAGKAVVVEVGDFFVVEVGCLQSTNSG